MVKGLFIATALAGSLATAASAATVADPLGDIFPAFIAANFPGGNVPGGFDVLSFSVTRDSANFFISATMAGPLSGIGNGIHVIGVDRGQGTPRFGNDQPGVLFDSVIVIQSNGTGSVTLLVPTPPAATPLPAGSVVVNGNSYTLTLPFSFLPSLGFGLDRYGFNLWPRLPGGPFSNISDFAPNNAVLAINSVPEPATWALMLGGFGLAGWAARRRRFAAPRTVA